MESQIMHNPPLARLGMWAHANRMAVIVAWAVFAIGLGIFAPKLEHALSGAMWEVDGSDSLAARDVIDREFGGLSSQSAAVVVWSDTLAADDPAFQAHVAEATAAIAEEPAFGPAIAQPGPDGKTVMLQAGALVDPTEAVRAAERLNEIIGELGDDQVNVVLTGSPAFWGDFNTVNKDGMMKAELLTWPVTAVILVIAFGTLAAAGLPLLLAGAGLVSAMGVLYGITQFTDLSIWTLNFAMMFSIALGIDYALFIVTRYRGALHATPNDPGGAAGVAMDTAGKAVLFSGLTVLISLSAVLLVPIPAFRSMAAGMMLAVAFVLLAAMTLLPALLGSWINRLALPWHSAGEHRSPAWERFASRIQPRALLYAIGVTAGLLVLSAPLLNLETGMPGINVLPESKQARQGYEQLATSFGPGGPGPIQVVVPAAADANAIAAIISGTPGIAMAFPPQLGAEGSSLIQAIATTDPSSKESIALIGTLRDALPSSVLVGGPVAENHDLDQTLRAKAPLVIGVVLLLGFLLLLFALQAVFIAAAGVVFNLLSVGAAFGVGALAFQHGWLAGPMNFESQGYLTSWAPLFFFTLVFAISMDYTVFLLASAREHYEHSHDGAEAVRGSIAHTGRPIVAAAAVMIAVFYTFAIAGPLPMKEMGIILGTAVLIDAFLVRLVLVPAVLYLAGDKAWWLPRWADRMLPDVRFAH
ncbi:MAG: MMPL family transporter [Dehalococcoidia bacterium]|nr:MMPL family transporter [Dehalococcoidia bacterium]